MNIQQKDDGRNGSFYIYDNGRIVGEMTYEHSNHKAIIINHTEVDEALRGKGIGNELVSKGVAYAKANNLKIIPVCPFAKMVIKNNAAFADVLVK